MLEHVVANAQSAASKLRVKSALNPMLWLCGIISLPCFTMAYLLNTSPLAMAFFSMGAVPVVATIAGFLWFMISQPEKLQSEEYQLRHEAIDVIRQKGSPLEVSPASLEAIANPAIHQLHNGGVK